MIEVKDLMFKYPKAKEKTLKELNFKIDKGEIFGFLGPSGAGKSTTQKILIGILKDYLGSVKILGKEIINWNTDFYEKIGVSFELPNLYHKLTALENLDFVKSFYSGKKEDSKKLLEMVGLEKNADVKVSKYSKGMKMRLNFVRAFIHNPDIVFFDEPTSGLDPLNAKNIKNIIMEKKHQGKTIFLTTHNMTVADELCDRVAFIVDGEIKLIDSPKKLKIEHGKRNIKVEYIDKNKFQEKDFALKGIGYNDEYIKLLREKEIKTIHTQEATLEDIFVQTTGRKLL
ncbi:ABC transporter ATP-binding protein [Sporosalibacterium faouarense]|uniref:ABC transporter ATP-binding protein n=1 Tax=Sporosalibacterium faouarense TaxID=516123 RepID=UPI00192CA8CB|nr:ABC transporter ATP-binding protein [Sporosalibacterium faouarense]